VVLETWGHWSCYGAVRLLVLVGYLDDGVAYTTNYEVAKLTSLLEPAGIDIMRSKE
jgi:hypothetical protein